MNPFRCPESSGVAVPAILVHELDGDCYRLVQTLTAGEVAEARLPFPVRLDPARLLSD